MYYDENLRDVFLRLNSSGKGLTDAQAGERIKQFGFNELEQKKKKSKLLKFLAQFNNFVIYILIAATVVSIFLGELVDASVIGVILVANAVFGYVQEAKAEASIEALKKMASLQAAVLRGGAAKHIDSKLLVPGDIILLEAGDKIPADCRVIESLNLETQEAALTGESVPVKKEEIALPAGRPVADQVNMVFAGTVITSGRGKAIVATTGMKTELGRIAHLIQEVEPELTPMQKKVEALGKTIGFVVLGICTVVFAMGMLSGGAVLEMFLAAVALAVAAIPEGLPAVITIALALGVQKMAKKSALMRNLPSVETLGAVTVICTDKTGTLTKNEMTVKKIFTNNLTISVSGTGYAPDGEFSEKTTDLIFKIGALCNNAMLSKEAPDLSAENVKEVESWRILRWKVVGDPTEACLLTVARKYGLHEEQLRKMHPRLHEIQFDSERKRMTTIHKVENREYAYVKGAPDIILGLCSKININGKEQPLTQKERGRILKINGQFTGGALRVLGFAYKDVTHMSIKKIDEKIAQDVEKDLVFVGLQGMIDPSREEAKIAIEKCRSAGIKIVMITGDHIGTAVAVARELGIEGKAIEGKKLDDESFHLEKQVEETCIYARVNPEHKLKIVDALKKKGHIVAMTGDGVNDAPALKKADMGIAMGITGTDVAKEASSMILTDDNFASIVGAVEEGRTICTNIKKFVFFLLSSNMGEVLILFLAMIFAKLLGFVDAGGAVVLPLVAVQILWVNLVTDGLPALALSMDPAPDRVMARRPRHPKEQIITTDMFASIIAIGLIMAAAALFMFKLGLASGVGGVALGRTYALTTVVVFELLAAVSIVKSHYHKETWSFNLFDNKWLILAIAASLGLHFLILYVPFLSSVFKIVPLGLMDWAYVGIAVACTYVAGIVTSIVVKKIWPDGK